jgi:hypothetical protein
MKKVQLGTIQKLKNLFFIFFKKFQKDESTRLLVGAHLQRGQVHSIGNGPAEALGIQFGRLKPVHCFDLSTEGSGSFEDPASVWLICSSCRI